MGCRCGVGPSLVKRLECGQPAPRSFNQNWQHFEASNGELHFGRELCRGRLQLRIEPNEQQVLQRLRLRLGRVKEHLLRVLCSSYRRLNAKANGG